MDNTGEGYVKRNLSKIMIFKQQKTGKYQNELFD